MRRSPATTVACAIVLVGALVASAAPASANAGGQDEMLTWLSFEQTQDYKVQLCNEWRPPDEKSAERQMDAIASEFFNVTRQETAEVMYRLCSGWGNGHVHLSDPIKKRYRARTKLLHMSNAKWSVQCYRYWNGENKTVAKFATKHHITKRQSGQVLYTVCGDRYTDGLPDIGVPEWWKI